MVGSRTASPYGRRAAEEIAADLAGAGVVVVSGAARGIDGAAHKGALKKGSTVAVLGCGVDIAYPRENEGLLAEIAESGAVNVSPVFPVVFEAWQKHQRLRITYDDMKGGEPTVREVDPHVLFLYAREWRIKAYCHYRKAPRTFVISRMLKAEMLPDTFTPDMGIINSVTLDNIVSWRKYADVKIRITGEARKFALANRMHSKQRLKKYGRDAWLFTIPEVPEQVIVPWILSQRGEAVPIEPPEIVEAVKASATALLNNLS